MLILSPKLLRKFRKTRKKKQSEIAQLLGVKRPTYVGYEKRDAIEVTPEAAEAVAKFLKVDIAALQSQEKVEDGGQVFDNFKYRIFEGDYIGLHRMAWDEFQKTLKHEREALTEITKNNSKLTDSNTTLSNNINELVKLLRPNE